MSEWNACTQEPTAWLRWLECHVGFGTYLQTFGVVAAILGSVWITRWSTQRMLQPVLTERAGRARTIIYRLLPPISRIRGTIVRVREVYKQTEGGMMLAAERRLDQAVYYFRIDTVLPTEVLDSIHVLDEETGETVAQLYYYLDQYNEFVDRNVPLLRDLDGDGRSKFSAVFETLIGAVEKLSDDSWKLLQKAREANSQAGQ